MGFWNFLGSSALAVLIFLWYRFAHWLYIFIAPILNPRMLWIIIPIWVTWFFTEFFQEKKGTSLGNAVTNGAIMIWVGIDWIRFLIDEISEGILFFSWNVVSLFTICAVVMGLGLFIILEGLRVQKFIKVVGRVRETTYVMVMFSPVIYGIINLSFLHIISVILFFPVFYFLIEWIVRITPNPKTYEDSSGGDGKSSSDDLGGLN